MHFAERCACYPYIFPTIFPRTASFIDAPPKADIPIIAMTANAFSEDKQAALDAGMNDHIAKPINMNILVPTIRKYLRYGQRAVVHKNACRPQYNL